MASPYLIRLRTLITASSFLRFLISGGLNTVLTYAAYLGFLRITGYKAAFTLAYVVGIGLGFALNRFFVFQTNRGWRSFALFPLVYLTQYLVSLVIVWVWVGRFHLPEEAAPLIAIVVTIPLTFGLSRLVFGTQSTA